MGVTIGKVSSTVVATSQAQVAGDARPARQGAEALDKLKAAKGRLLKDALRTRAEGFDD